ncbi:hypothetical protein VITU102760_24265 [Vibrio tubiashii]|uniref:Uncharacterized protein n=1 Tax=Vibrio tubiashii ATCC 19109 TaxID=1051646 RepID=F9T597_9VIBR|nr:hypothetical protein [Vibrio tubiashii]AIW17450.1 hypothetical protein IX91_25675 [Vibrio tubiashii ATCC 19109]EGU55294.1 hypothetical protein VITU9109_21149 [Vibrio tubiashii ATCC 19109]EIF04424.1 hypothetical protein VT1337_08656 [Vibrio tubiashii NCIMB 1337 = ATCC 19106]
MHFSNLDPFADESSEQRKLKDAEYRAKRKAYKCSLIDTHHLVVASEQKKSPNFEFGFKARRLFPNGEWKYLPEEFARILKALEEFIDNPNRFPALNAWVGSAINNIQCRRLIAKVLACMLPNTDLIGGRVGLPTEAGMQTISYNQLQEDYALRWGEYISPKSFGKVIRYLKLAGYYSSERINVCVDSSEGSVRSAAAYKQFSERFFSDLKVVRYKNIAQFILATRERQEKKGLRFNWMSFRTIASGIQEMFNASTLNRFADTTAKMFLSKQIQPRLLPG